MLDLLDEVGGSKTADEEFRRWVSPARMPQQLDARAKARTAYAALVAAGGDWKPPLLVRTPMAEWSFDEATKQIGRRARRS